MASLAWFVFGGLFSWLVTTFVGNPVKLFFDIRYQAGVSLRRHVNTGPLTQGEGNQPMRDAAREAIREGRTELCARANELATFSESWPTLTRFLGLLGYNLMQASAALTTLAANLENRNDRSAIEATCRQALKLR